MLVIANVSGTIDSGKVLNIVPHSSVACGLQMDGVNNTFSGSLTVTNNVSTANITTTNITCANLYSFINTSISTQCTNYNSSLVSFINTSVINQCTNYNSSLVSFINTSTISQCTNYNSSLVSFINTSIINAAFNLTNVMNTIIFNYNALGTTYSGAKIVLWPGGTLNTSTDWYGFGMNSYTLVYNAPTSAKHSFQINGTECTSIKSTGITTTGNLNFNNAYTNTLYLNDVLTTTNIQCKCLDMVIIYT